MRSWSAACLALAVLLAVAPCSPGRAESVTAADLLDFIPDVVADYGTGEQLRRDDVIPLIAPQIQAMLANGVKPTPEQVRDWTAKLVEGMLNQRLVLREALRHGAKLDIEAGQRLVADQKERLGEKAFQRALKLQGVSADTLAQHLAENEAVNQWLDSAAPPDAAVTDQAAQAYYDAHPEQFRQPAVYHVAHLLVAVPEGASDADVAKARETIAALRAEVARGVPFATLAEKHSDCPSKADGGDLGPLPAGRMPPAFEAAAMALEPGQIGEPVRSPYGWHLIRGGPVTPGYAVPFAPVRESILAGLRDAARERARQDLIRRLREEAHVSVYLPAPQPSEPAAPAAPERTAP